LIFEPFPSLESLNKKSKKNISMAFSIFFFTSGQALSNIMVSLNLGITTIDSSVAGLGGCPYAKGATGNVATEDVVYMLNGMNITTGIDIEKLVDASEFICNILNRPINSKAGSAIAAKRQNKKQSDEEQQ
jgi:hydroxymethylglutaryl-CoA lyase